MYDYMCIARVDRKTIAGWLQQVGKEVQTDSQRRARNEYGRYLRYIVQSGEPLPNELTTPLCSKESPASLSKPDVRNVRFVSYMRV